MRSACAVLLLSLLALAIPGCRLPPDACGEFPAEGGPAVIRTREQEVCELSRLRMAAYLARNAPIEPYRGDGLYERARAWERAKSLHGLDVQVRKEMGDAYADALSRAIGEVRSRSSRPHDEACDDPDRCLARAAGHGARLALEHREAYCEPGVILGGREPGESE